MPWQRPHSSAVGLQVQSHRPARPYPRDRTTFNKYRDHVWPAEGLAAHGNPIRQVPNGLPLRNCARRNRHLLAMSPGPKPVTQFG